MISTTDDFYGPEDGWTQRDWYAVFRFLTHAFGRAPRSPGYARELGRLAFERMPAGVLAIARAALEECPMGAAYLTDASLEAVRSARPLEEPIVLTEGAGPGNSPEPYRSMGVYV